MFKILLSLFFIGFLTSTPVLAAAKSSSTKKKSEPASSPQFSLNPEIAYSRNLVQMNDGSYSEGLEYNLVSAFKTQVGTFSNSLTYFQNLTDPSTNDFRDSSLKYGMPAFEWDFFESMDLTLSPSVTAIIPLSKNSKNNEHLQTALVGGLGYSFKFKKLPEFEIGIGFSLGRNFHQYETDEGGQVLVKYTARQKLWLEYSMEHFAFGIDGIYRKSWTYQDTPRENFEISESVRYSPSDVFYIGMGHTNAGNVLKPNGYESNIEILNDNNSVIFLVMGSLISF